MHHNHLGFLGASVLYHLLPMLQKELTQYYGIELATGETIIEPATARPAGASTCHRKRTNHPAELEKSVIPIDMATSISKGQR